METNRREFIASLAIASLAPIQSFATFASFQNATNLNFLLLEDGSNLVLQDNSYLVAL